MPYNVQMTEAALFSHLDQAAQSPLVLTSNPRAARTLRAHYGLWQQKNNQAAWRTPQISTWDAWLAEMWNELLMAGVTQQAVLTTSQERQLWQEIIRSDKETESGSVGYSNSLGELAHDSQHALEEYCISNTQLEHAANGKDSRTFLRWLSAFQSQCRRRDFLPPSALARRLAENIDQANLTLPREIFLIGFDRVPPSQQNLLQKLQHSECEHSYLWLTPEQAASAAPVIVAADTMEEEFHAVACWIRKRLAENPHERIGVLAPSITEWREVIDRVFRRVLAPSTLNIHKNPQRLPYEFTLGTPLNKLPQVQAALLLLRWLTRPIAFDDASFLIVSGHVGGGSREARARLDAAIRKNPQLLGGEPGFAWLLHRLRESNVPSVTPLQQSMIRVAALATEADIFSGRSPAAKRRTHTEWREGIDELLKVADWTVLQAKTSAEFQLLKSWNTMLDELSMLDSIEDSLSFPDMLTTLEEAASRTLYAQETQEAPVQIMGAHESAGLTFDAIWFLHASATGWPSRGLAQPWIPWQLQRQAKMPYADTQADYDHTRNVTERIVAASKDVVFSFALEDSAEETSTTRKPSIDVRISPILQDWMPTEVVAVSAREWLPEIALHGRLQETYGTVPVENEFTVPFTKIKIRQGVRFLKQQSACPFKAFAELRLSATAMEEPSIGLAANAQGSAIHDVLRDFWTQVKDRNTLRTLSTEQRQELLDTYIRRTLGKFPVSSFLEKALLSTEAERLRDRLFAWLEIEAQRPDFSVEACEEVLQDVPIDDLQVDCRIDRIDRVGEGLALMDYKTGPVSASACDGERPEEPQIPAYAMFLHNRLLPGESLRGIAVASLQAKDIGFKIIQSLPQTFSAVDPKKSKSRTPILHTEEEFLAQIAKWEQMILRLTDGFHAGIASVDPKTPGVTCKYCTQSILCRVVEAQLPTKDEDDESTEEKSSAEQDA